MYKDDCRMCSVVAVTRGPSQSQACIAHHIISRFSHGE